MSIESQVPFAAKPEGSVGPNDAQYLARAEAAEAARTGQTAPAAEIAVPEQKLAGKFSSPAELEKAYIELQSKLGSAAPDKESPAKAEAAPASLTTESFTAYVDEYAQNGALSDKSYEALAKMGVAKELVDSYIEGRRSAAAAAENSVYSEVGGREQYQAMVSWAAQTLPAEEIDAYNEVINSGDSKKTLFAVRSLAARFKSNNSVEPARTVEGRRTEATDSFKSRAEMVAAMNDPRYAKDPAYRQSVIQRLSNSNLD